MLNIGASTATNIMLAANRSISCTTTGIGLNTFRVTRNATAMDGVTAATNAGKITIIGAEKSADMVMIARALTLV